MRSSPIALGRLFFQEHGRGKGKKASKPRINSTRSEIVLENGTVAEAVITKGATPLILPQIILDANSKFTLTGSDEHEVKKFIGELADYIKNDVHLVEKLSTGIQTKYSIRKLTNTENPYEQQEGIISDKPPKKCIWIECVDNTENENYPPQSLQASRGTNLGQG